MDKKNTMLLTVIAVATLLVAVVGATFAYFAIGATANNNAKTTVTGSTENAQVGSVALEGKSDITMTLTAEDMSEANKNHTFYATSEGTAKRDDQGGTSEVLTVGTVTLTGGSKGVVYECTANYKVTYDDADSPGGAITWSDESDEGTGDDGAVLTFKTVEGVTITGDMNSPIKLKDLKIASTDGKEGVVKFKLVGGTTETLDLQATLAIKNSDKPQQERLANKKFKITIETVEKDGAKPFACDTVAS